MSEADDPVWKALADPIRRRVLDLLREGPQTTGALCAPFPQTRFGVMKHLDALQAAGLVTVERRGRQRWNHLNGAALERAVARWLTPFQSAWSQRLARLTEFVAEESPMETANASLMEIRQVTDMPAPVERVFRALTREIDLWWTSPFRQAGAESRLELQPEIGAAMIEHGPGGHSVIWARVEEIAPPSRLYLSGRFAVAGAAAGRVHFDLEALADGGSRLTVAHLAIGAIASETRDAFTGGWRELIERRLIAHLGEGVHV